MKKSLLLVLCLFSGVSSGMFISPVHAQSETLTNQISIISQQEEINSMFPYPNPQTPIGLA